MNGTPRIEVRKNDLRDVISRDSNPFSDSGKVCNVIAGGNKLQVGNALMTFFRSTHLTSVLVGASAALLLTNSAVGQAICTAAQALSAKVCAGDTTSSEERALFEIVNKYRTANGRSALRLSAPLSVLANRRALDMRLNMKMLTHSWSNCAYDVKNEKTFDCVTEAPRRFNTGYNGQGYETLYRTATGTADPKLALQAWQKSPPHNAIIVNSGIFSDLAWDEFGVAVDGQFAVLWFGHPGGGGAVMGGSSPGIGATYDQAVAGLSKILAVKQVSSTGVENNKWQGYSADKKIKLEIYGAKRDINEANIAITMKLESGRLSPQANAALSTLLKNLFPEWADRDAWIAGAVASIAANSTASKTKVVRNVNVEVSSGGPGTLRLAVTPSSKPRYIEVF